MIANRDEATDRPSSPPETVYESGDRANWLGGRDLRAGGTWLGVNSAALLVAVTNRPKSAVPVDAKSRGLLCRDLLERSSLEAAEREFHRQWERESFAGFNLLMISHERGLVVSAGDELNFRPIEPGLHAITNGDWNDPHDKRIQRARNAIEVFPGRSIEEWIERAKKLAGSGDVNPGDAICLPRQNGYGTVSSTIIGLGADLSRSRYLHAAGSPADTPFIDYSSLLVSLLKTDEKPMHVHPIRLRGPWRYEWLTSGFMPRAGRATLPVDWRELFGTAGGRVRFSRVFHAPTNLEESTQLSLVFEGISGWKRIVLNDQELRPDESEEPIRVPITEALLPKNELVVEIEFDPNSSDGPGGIWGMVVLEIRE